MKNPTKIILIGAGVEGVTAVIMNQLKSDYGDDVVVLTEEQAKLQGILPDSLPKVKPFELKSLPRFEMPFKMNDIKEEHKSNCRKGWRKH